MTEQEAGEMEVIEAARAGEILLPMMNKAEAEETDLLIRESEAIKRIRVYLMWKRKGFAQLGYAAFETYCEERIDTPRATAYRWVTQVETSLECGLLTLSQLSHSKRLGEADAPRLLPGRVATELSKLSAEPAKMMQAFLEYEGLALANHQAPTSLAVKRTVKRLQGEDAPIAYVETRPDTLQEKMQAFQLDLPEMPAPIDPEPEECADAEPTELDTEALLFDIDIVRGWLKYPESIATLPVKTRLRIMASLVELAKYFERGG